MNSLYGIFEFVTLQTQSYDSHQGTNWSKKLTNQWKKPAQTSSLPRHKTAHKQESKGVISSNRKDIYLLPGNHAMAQKLIVLGPVPTQLTLFHEEQD